MSKYKIRAVRTKYETVENVIEANSKEEALRKVKIDEERFSRTSHVINGEDKGLIEISELNVIEKTDAPWVYPSY